MATISIKGQICDGPIAKMIVSLKAKFSNIFHLSAGLHKNVDRAIRDWAYDSLAIFYIGFFHVCPPFYKMTATLVTGCHFGTRSSLIK